MFTTISDAVQWIESVKRFGDKLDLKRMELACKILGNPEQKLPVIHIAGTNGKGSTVSYLRYMLLEHGYNVGTYTSPYIVRFNERITYNYNDISDEELLLYINKMYEIHQTVQNEYQETITFFELVTLISFLFFADRDVDFVIYEVGLGGTLDATNVVRPMIAAITSISFDHMGVLGDSLESIALNKLGIVKDFVPLVTAVSDPELLELFETYTTKRHSDLIRVSKDDISDIDYGSYTNFKYRNNPYQISMMGTHQVVNASLAIEIMLQLEKMEKLVIHKNDLLQGLINTYWPGRMERFGNIILDGAHNVGGAIALRQSMETLFQGYKITVLYTSMADKEYFDIIQEIEKFADEIYFTEFDYPRCETAENLYAVSTHKNKHMSKDAYVIYNQLKHLKPKEILLITGSLYFVSYMRKAL